MLDQESCVRAAQAKDPRFDGRFYTAVTTTGIYCRPSCPAMTPHSSHMVFYPTAAGAQAAGYRACKRCRPGAAPGSPEWNSRADLVGRAMRLIADGFVDREGVAGLARHLGYSPRQLDRQLVAELGASPIALARAQRAETARLLIETTRLPFSAICFAAGFSSIRQFNDTIRAIFALTPSALRSAGARHLDAQPPSTLSLRLSYRAPFDYQHLVAFLGARAIPGVEDYRPGLYRRVLDLPHDNAVVEIECGPSASPPYLRASLRLGDLRDLTTAVARCRRLFDLDADPQTVDAALGDDNLLAPLVAARPGLRVPGAADSGELAVRAVLGQQVSVAGARTIAGRLAARFGRPLALADGTLTVAFPRPETLAGLSAAELPLPAARSRALLGLCEALAGGAIPLDFGAEREEAERALLALPGIGPWTAGYIRMRALGDPDAFLASDLGVRHALVGLRACSSPLAAEKASECWRPWRAYALQHLWASLPNPPSSGGADARATAPRQRSAV